ncbi:hypothetical protein Hte_003254 [Hypoxylon texense]
MDPPSNQNPSSTNPISLPIRPAPAHGKTDPPVVASSSSTNPPANPPKPDHTLSEWAQNWWPHEDPYWVSTIEGEKKIHSGLTPVFPSRSFVKAGFRAIPAAELAEKDNEDGYVPLGAPLDTPSYASLDRIFYSEAYQMKTLKGLKSWQLGILSADLYNGHKDTRTYGGDSVAGWNAFLTEVMKPKPQGIFPWLHKDSFYDLDYEILKELQNPLREIVDAKPDRWSVDNPIVWRYMEIAMEWVGRVYDMLCVNRNWKCVESPY